MTSTYNVTTIVRCATSFVGFHRWADAPDATSYLRERHRHVFQVKAEVEVVHGDREVEFHTLKHTVDAFLHERYHVDFVVPAELDETSCEQIAGAIVDVLRVYYPDRPYYAADVSEDGENGAIVEALVSTMDWA